MPPSDRDVTPFEDKMRRLNDLLSHTYNPVVFEQAVEAIHQRYLPAMEQLFGFLQQEATP